jgi:hypothetical protein
LKKGQGFGAKQDSITNHAWKRKALDGKWFMDPKCGHANCLCSIINKNCLPIT